jgi:hypothetical protein
VTETTETAEIDFTEAPADTVDLSQIRPGDVIRYGGRHEQLIGEVVGIVPRPRYGGKGYGIVFDDGEIAVLDGEVERLRTDHVTQYRRARDDERRRESIAIMLDDLSNKFRFDDLPLPSGRVWLHFHLPNRDALKRAAQRFGQANGIFRRSSFDVLEVHYGPHVTEFYIDADDDGVQP